MGVIRSKITPHRLPVGAVARPALIQRLRGGRGSALTLISAPAGYGKTTLLTAWAEDLGSAHVAWVSLDRGDIDPARLWTHAIAALAVTEPAVGTASLAALRAHPEEFDSYGLPALLDEIPDEGADVVLMLDDFHLAETAQIIATIGAFLRYRPARVQLVISTRA